MKKWMFLLGIMMFISGCGGDDNPLNDNIPKGESPTIDFYTSVDEQVNGKTEIKISASDYDGDLNKIELYIDGELAETQEYSDYKTSYSIYYGYDYDYSSKYYLFNVNFDEYRSGSHTIYAKAIDDEGNISKTESKYITSEKFSGKIRIDILKYEEIGTIDGDGSSGDPYFKIKFMYYDNIKNVTSNIFSNENHLYNPYYCEFKIPTDIETFSFNIIIKDADAIEDDYLDYCPETGGDYYTHTIYLKTLKYDGSDSFSYKGDDAKSCKLKYKVSVVNE